MITAEDIRELKKDVYAHNELIMKRRLDLSRNIATIIMNLPDRNFELGAVGTINLNYQIIS